MNVYVAHYVPSGCFFKERMRMSNIINSIPKICRGLNVIFSQRLLATTATTGSIVPNNVVSFAEGISNYQ